MRALSCDYGMSVPGEILNAATGVLKKLEEARLQQSYEVAVELLDRIPPGVQLHEKQRSYPYKPGALRQSYQ